MEKEEHKADEPVGINVVVRTSDPNALLRVHPVPKSVEPHFPEQMMEACCVACAKEHQYPDNGAVRRYFSLSESNTSFAGMFYSNLSAERGFAEKLTFTLLDGLQIYRELGSA